MARRRRVVSVAAVGVVLVAAGLASTASAAPGREQAARPAVAKGPATKLPPAKTAGITGVVGLATSARAARARVNVYVPPVQMAAYTYPESRVPKTPFALAPRNFQPKRPNPACNYYLFKLNTDLYAIDMTQRDDATPGTIRTVGVFPDAKVSMMAFGSLPATAVLHVSQVVRNGKIQPIYADQYSGGIAVYKNGPQDFDHSGCDAAWESGQPYPLVSSGDVDARISDVRVDGRTVPVGDSCRTVAPLHLNLRGESPDQGGEYGGVLDGGKLYQRKDDTLTLSKTNPLPLYPGSSNLTIPAFTGCRSGSGDDVSRLITALVSGADNTLAVNQGKTLTNSFDPDSPSLCYAPDDTVNEPHCYIAPDSVRPPVAGR